MGFLTIMVRLKINKIYTRLFFLMKSVNHNLKELINIKTNAAIQSARELYPKFNNTNNLTRRKPDHSIVC